MSYIKDKDYRFEVSGGFSIRCDLKEEEAANGSVVGFVLPDGRTASLIVAIELEGPDGCEYITRETDMAALGFMCLDYETADFERLAEEVE